MSLSAVLTECQTIADDWIAEALLRQERTAARPEDLERLRAAGVHLLAVPTELGGRFEDPARSTRLQATVLRTLARGDPSLALIAAMHPVVLAAWRRPDVPEPFAAAWTRQREEVYESVRAGAWWGTMISEPASGGDVSQVASCAQPAGPAQAYRLSGLKQFASGSGLTGFMVTRARVEEGELPDLFYLEVGGVPWDGSQGLRLVAPWRGRGMRASNSHAFELRDFPATRAAWPNNPRELAKNGGLGCLAFISVALGVVDAALSWARARLAGKVSRGTRLRAFQRVEWIRAEEEAWLAEQAWEGLLRGFAEGAPRRREALLAKQGVARLAEACLGRLCRLIGGSAYTLESPLGGWFEDVRALGHLRPPWGLGCDQSFALSGLESSSSIRANSREGTS